MKIVKDVISQSDFTYIGKAKEFYHTELIETGISKEYVTYQFREFYPNEDGNGGKYGKNVTYKEYLKQIDSCLSKEEK